jgi:hypothetical protein
MIFCMQSQSLFHKKNYFLISMYTQQTWKLHRKENQCHHWMELYIHHHHLKAWL